MGLLRKLQSRLELHRLEKKYMTRRKAATSSPAAQYVDGEYIYQTPSSHSSHHISSPQYTSSSSTFAAIQHHPFPTTSSSFTSAAPPISSVTTTTTTSTSTSTIYTGNGSGNIKHSSWQSLTPSSIGGSGSGNTLVSSARNSTNLTASLELPVSHPAISKNSRGQSWEPPRQGWGGDGTDAFKSDKGNLRFDVDRDRTTVATH